MVSLVTRNLKAIKEFCVQYRVRRLELFGSAIDDENFDTENSDLDFLVEFQPLWPGEYADTYFGLLEDLENLFARHVDLVMVRAVKNPYFLEFINRSRKPLYTA
jgi:predicted nucleotidyltransferase